MAIISRRKVYKAVVSKNKGQGVIFRYRKFLPVTSKTPVITLNEGNTPLLSAENISRAFKEKIRVYLKCEGFNPTGSFKDRGMTVAISKAKEAGAKAVICASTGNTSASASAYAARAGLKCVVLLPQKAIALGKLSQALIHGASVLAVDGNFDDALRLVKELSGKHGITLVNSLNPYRLEGQKTASFEICDAMGKTPDFQAMPVGNAGNITAYWQGYNEYKEAGLIKKLPCLLGFQAAGAAPIVEGRVIEHPETVATAIRIGNPARWKEAEKAKNESAGLIEKVTDEEIMKAYKMLASLEGVFVEPASAASLAGVKKLFERGYFKNKPGAVVVCVLTGHGLKDPECVMKVIKHPPVVPPDVERVEKELGL